MNNILQAAASLYPGTAWNLRDGVLEQANDGTPRVPVPDMATLQAILAANPDPPPLPDLQSQIIALVQGGPALANLKSALSGKKASGL